LYKSKVQAHLCGEICSDKIIKICWRRKHNEPCIKYRDLVVKEILAHKHEKYLKILEQTQVDYIGEDTFDSMGDDISKEEFLENEMFFGRME